MIRQALALSIRHRWWVILLGLGAVAIGAWSLLRLPIDAVPDITDKQVQVNTTAPALSPAEIEKQVTFRVETALAGIPGLDRTRSISRNGFSQVTAVFAEKTDIYFARQQINERLIELRANLPPGVAPKMGPISTGLGEIYMWTVGFSSPEVADAFVTPEGERLTTAVERAAYLRTVQDWIVRPQIKAVVGVAGVDSLGGYVKQYQVQPDPMKLVGLGLSFDDIVSAIEANNTSRGANVIERNGEGITVRTGGRVERISDIEQVVLSTRDGVPVRVSDVATVAIGGEIRTGSASENGREVVLGTALMLIGSNSRTVAAAVDARLDQIRRTLPPGIEIQTVLNRTKLVNATIETVATNLGEGALLVILVLFALLGNFRAAFIAALVIPMAMLMTAAGMLQGHISANLMSLGALDFGLIVDGAVIITENALRRLAQRQAGAGGRPLSLSDRLTTVQAAAQEVIAPTVYGQAIIILVYLPLLTFSGVEAKMFEPMALTVILALVAAFVLSITFVPAAIAILVTGRVSEGDNAAVRYLKRGYAPLLARTISRPLPAIAGAVILLIVALLVFLRLGQEFTPTLDEKDVLLEVRRIPSTSLNQSQAMQLDLEKALSALPQVAFVFSKTGTADLAADPMPPSASDTYMMLKPRDQWPDPKLTKAALLEQIETVARKWPGNSYGITQPIQMRFNELLAGERGDLVVKVFGDEFGPLLQSADQIAAILRATEGATDVKVEQAEGLSILDVTVDKTEIARRGLNLAAVQQVIGTAIGGREAGVVFEGDRHFEIEVRLSDAIRNDIEALKNLPVSLPSSGRTLTVPLGQVASFTLGEGPNQISRENGRRRVVVTANVRNRDIASVVNDARTRVESEVRLPAGYSLAWGGQFENLAIARQRLSIVVPACFLLIFLFLTSALGTARDALLVFSAVPLALTGGVAALWLRGMPFSVSAAVGFIALSGIAVLNGLVMLTYIKQLMANGLGRLDAIREGSLTRLRPVAMTALVASLGFVPMALATGTGAEVQRPIATVVIGGLISATLLTLIVLPALYARFGRGPRRAVELVEPMQRAAE